MMHHSNNNNNNNSSSNSSGIANNTNTFDTTYRQCQRLILELQQQLELLETAAAAGSYTGKTDRHIYIHNLCLIRVIDPLLIISFIILLFLFKKKMFPM